MNHLNDQIDPELDNRVDAFARSVGSELRTPAPSHGFAGIRHARRRQQVSRIGTATVAVALLAVGVGLLVNRNQRSTNIDPSGTLEGIAPSVSAATVVPVSAATVVPVTSPPASATPAPVVTQPDQIPVNPASRPGQLYAPGPDTSTQTLIDAVTGSATGTALVDDALSEQVRNANQLLLANEFRTTSASGLRTYDSSSGVLDECGQVRLGTVDENAAAVTDSLVPSNAASFGVTPDGTTLVVVAKDCAAAANGIVPLRIEIFDADNPQVAGRNPIEGQLTTGVDTVVSVGLEASGRYASVVAAGATPNLDVFEVVNLSTGEVIDVLRGCSASGMRLAYRTTAGLAGETPAGAISANGIIAFASLCADGTHHAVIQNLADANDRVDVVIAGASTGNESAVELDYSSLAGTSTAWFVVRTGPAGGTATRSFIGHGSEPLREIDGVDSATFIPEWSPGG